MTVGELIIALQAFHPDAIVIASRDDEGNGFNPVEPEEEILRPIVHTNTWADGSKHQWLHFEPVHPQDVADGEYEPEDVETFVPGVCFWPASIPAPGETAR
jgi:hypothetical protein